MINFVDRARELVNQLGMDWDNTRDTYLIEILQVAISAQHAEDQHEIAKALTALVDRGVDIRVTGGKSSAEFPLRHSS